MWRLGLHNFNKNCSIEDIWSVITLESEVVIESTLTVRKSCKHVNIEESSLLNEFNQEDNF